MFKSTTIGIVAVALLAFAGVPAQSAQTVHLKMTIAGSAVETQPKPKSKGSSADGGGVEHADHWRQRD